MNGSNDRNLRLPAPHPRVLARRLQGEMVLVHLDSNQIYTLNETGARFWELLSAGEDLPTIEHTLHAEFDVSSEAVTEEIDRLLGELARLGLVR